jgi:hypothetical protein
VPDARRAGSASEGRPVPLVFSRKRVEAAAELRISCTPP